MSSFANSITSFISRSVCPVLFLVTDHIFCFFYTPSNFLLDAGHCKFKFLSAEFCCIPLKNVSFLFFVLFCFSGRYLNCLGIT